MDQTRVATSSPLPAEPVSGAGESAGLPPVPTTSFTHKNVRKGRFSVKMLLGAAFMLLLVVGGGVALYLSQQQQDLRQAAYDPEACNQFNNNKQGCESAGCVFTPNTCPGSTSMNCRSVSGCNQNQGCSCPGANNPQQCRELGDLDYPCDWGDRPGCSGTATTGSCTEPTGPTATPRPPTPTPNPGYCSSPNECLVGSSCPSGRSPVSASCDAGQRCCAPAPTNTPAPGAPTATPRPGSPTATPRPTTPPGVPTYTPAPPPPDGPTNTPPPGTGGTSGAKDTVAPSAPTFPETSPFNRYDNGSNTINFTWNWSTDGTCLGCEGPVRWCENNLPVGPFNPAHGASCSNRAFWFQLVWLGTSPGTQITKSPDNGTGQTSVSANCAGKEGTRFRLDVKAQDARNNQSAWATKTITCGGTPQPTDTPAPPPPDGPTSTPTATPTLPPGGATSVSCTGVTLQKSTSQAGPWTTVNKNSANVYEVNHGDWLRYAPSVWAPTGVPPAGWSVGMRYGYNRSKLNNLEPTTAGEDAARFADPRNQSVWCGRRNNGTVQDEDCIIQADIQRSFENHYLYFVTNVRSKLADNSTYWCRWLGGWSRMGADGLFAGDAAAPAGFRCDIPAAAPSGPNSDVLNNGCNLTVKIAPPPTPPTAKYFQPYDGCMSYNAENAQQGNAASQTLDGCLGNIWSAIAYCGQASHRVDGTGKAASVSMYQNGDSYIPAPAGGKPTYRSKLNVYRNSTAVTYIDLAMQTYICAGTLVSGECPDKKDLLQEVVRVDFTGSTALSKVITYDRVLNQSCGSIQLDTFIFKVNGSQCIVNGSDFQRPAVGNPGSQTAMVCNQVGMGDQQCGLPASWPTNCPDVVYQCSGLTLYKEGGGQPKQGDLPKITCIGTAGSRYTIGYKAPGAADYTNIVSNSSTNWAQMTTPLVAGKYSFRCSVAAPPQP